MDSPLVPEEAVKVIYDKETDTLSIILRPDKVAESDEARPGLILDLACYQPPACGFELR